MSNRDRKRQRVFVQPTMRDPLSAHIPATWRNLRNVLLVLLVVFILSTWLGFALL